MEFLIFLALQQVLDGIAANSKAVAVVRQIKVDGRVKDFTVHAVVEIRGLVEKFQQTQIWCGLQNCIGCVALRNRDLIFCHKGIHKAFIEPCVIDRADNNPPAALDPDGSIACMAGGGADVQRPCRVTGSKQCSCVALRLLRVLQVTGISFVV